MAMLLGQSAYETTLRDAILAELAARGWGAGGTPQEGSQAGNSAVAPSQIQLDLATALSKAISATTIDFLMKYAEVVLPDNDPSIPATHLGGAPPFAVPVIA